MLLPRVKLRVKEPGDTLCKKNGSQFMGIWSAPESTSKYNKGPIERKDVVDCSKVETFGLNYTGHFRKNSVPWSVLKLR